MKERGLERRQFLRFLASSALGLSLGQGCGPGGKPSFSAKKPKASSLERGLSIVQGEDPKVITKACLESLGGMKALVSKGDVVVVKPNIGFDRHPEQAATTNPEVVAAVVEMCLDAGAKRVKVFDRSCNDPRICYDRSGIAKAARNAGAEVSYVNDNAFVSIAIPQGKSMDSWTLYKDAIECDVLINIPVAKHHSSATLTMGMKNLMGIIGGTRPLWHLNLHQRIADLSTVAGVDLVILDAYRILKDHGPTGGLLKDVRLVKQVIAGTDPVAVDSYGASLFGLQSHQVSYIKKAHELGIGEEDLQKVPIKRLQI